MVMSRRRHSIRKILVAVAVAAVPLSLVARYERLHRLASYHRRQSHIGASKTPCTVAGKAMTAFMPTTDEGWWHHEMSYRLEAAARQPWWPFDPVPLPRDLPRREDVKFFAE